MSNSKLPANWKPCEVNHAPDLNQYEINQQCYSKLVNDLLWDAANEQVENNIILNVSLYKQISNMNSIWASTPFISHNWKPCI